MDLIESLARALLGDVDEIPYAALDDAFLQGIALCGRYTPAQQHELFNIWLRAFDHVDKYELTEEEYNRLNAAVEAILEYRRRLN